MEAITGQKAVTTKAKNAIANFKIREGMPIGCKAVSYTHLDVYKRQEWFQFSAVLQSV